MGFNPSCYYLDPFSSSAFVPNITAECFTEKKTSDVMTLPLPFSSDWKRAGFFPTSSLVYSSLASKVTDQILVPIAETRL